MTRRNVFLRLSPTIFIGLVLRFTFSRAWTTAVPLTKERSPSYSYSLRSSVEETTIPSTNHQNATNDGTVHLLSLNWTPDECISKPVRDVWKWKDSSLGDGRDFFVPKPKTIQALQDFILEHCPSLSECAVLSNCARLEIVCVTQDFRDPVEDISRALSAQLASSQARKRPMYAMLAQHVDLPDLAIDPKAPVACSEESDEIATHWKHLVGVEAVCRHLSLIAAGMALRPRRIDREVPFRPFSSRDAHILLQIKRTKEVANGRRVQQLLDYALRAGKAVRNEDKVPELKELRSFGSGDSKYSTEPPKELTQKVTKVGRVAMFDIEHFVRRGPNFRPRMFVLYRQQCNVRSILW
jgi:hypothetical protein